MKKETKKKLDVIHQVRTIALLEHEIPFPENPALH